MAGSSITTIRLIHAAATLNLELTGNLGLDLGPIGQNRVVVCQNSNRS